MGLVAILNYFRTTSKKSQTENLYKLLFETIRYITSVHDSLRVHMFQGGAQLDEILPDGSLRDEALLLLEVLDHPGEIPCVGELQHNVELVLLDERRQVLDDIRVIKLLK